MTDQSGRYGAQGDQPWYPGEQQPQAPYGQQQQYPQGYPQQDQSLGGQQQFVQPQGMGQQGYPQGGQPQMPMGQQGYPQQQGYGQQHPQGYPQQGQSLGGQQQFVQQPGMQQGRFAPQQGFPQQGQQPQQQMPMGDQYGHQPGRPGYGQQPQQAMQQQRPAPQPAPVSGPGPDGIDWEAEAAALDNPSAVPGARVAEPAEELDEHEQWAEDEYDEEEDDSFFADEDNSREAERKRKEKGKKSGRRNRGACLVVALVLLGGMGGAGWWGYGFYQDNFGPPPDFKGDGAGSVNITVKEGAGGGDIGKTLKDAGVVKSIGAFSAAYEKNPKGRSIQPGIYTLRHQMSAAAAVNELVESNGGNVLVFAEGMKSTDIYTKIDGKLKVPPGTTANIAKSQAVSLGLPAYANNNPEGFLFPARYSVTDGMKPEDLLKQMVASAVQHYNDLKLDEAAQKIGLKNAYEVVTEASILQAEGNNSEDFGKMARAISNRLTTNVTQHKLALDTTLQYQLGRTKLTSQEINDGSLKYNSYINPGLPPTPIGNPGEEALQAVLNPTPGDWVFWLAVSPQETKFAATGAEHAENTKNWCISRGLKFDSKSVTCSS
ncbi:endolytic transglycosylase MltG [Streptomyces sp. TLI_171]|uniref:endolytic transglycosylase MltG n=1 Tax=Streptomyces sp. TLI_171 TaxID=1938859 RepID=UPI000C19FA5D|nr:endolytic transglycosylase MltG [Streptomyces sp. TLI_171]RKE18030.1 UPF0755 protein [Streptomyces sp. TLI_171]